ncbi:hypothetical protein [Nostoc sp. TCL240-02]|uniref:hypothetical protein n=1 Tax=Nostoc sp. TCL240-02 TaxID=2572090 RepID=UPI00157F9132|nr:hypothetical protein [Nostoc sp. TCL240-02]QKQ76357.1 hypothetical protein FBB35_26470 [Nostoc sp. TCL240-02]
MALPLDSYIGFAQTQFDNGGKQWAALRLNKTAGGEPGRYDFTGTEFTLQTNAMAGIIDGDNYWLVVSMGAGSCNKGGVFEFKSWKQGEGGAKGTFDKMKGEELAKQWQIDGCNAVIYCNDIPVLKTMVKVLSELGLIVTNESREIVVRTNITTEQCIDLEVAMSEFWVYCLENDVDTLAEGMPQYDAALKLNDAGIMCLPALTDEVLPSVFLKSPISGKITGHKVECFPFKGELPSIDGVDVVLPKKEEKKGSKGNWSGCGSVDPAKMLEARVKFYVTEMSKCDKNIADIKGAFSSIKANKEYKEYSDLLLNVMGR